MTALDKLAEIRDLFEAGAARAVARRDFEELGNRFLSQKGLIKALLRETDFSVFSPEEKRRIGGEINALKEYASRQIESDLARLSKNAPTSGVDFTLPGIRRNTGSLHPISLVQMELEEIFHGMGFMVLAGHEVETEYYNFDALNTPSDHPARDMQDTFWLTNNRVLRTQTSASQVRTLQDYPPPVRAIFPGRCFRCEKIDASHEATFYQFEGLVVDRQVSVAHLIAVMKTFLTQVFGKDVAVRLRPGFFPFVEPGFELDIECVICGGEGCTTCKRSGWVELVPCGLVHPNVLKHGGVDPREFSGFAFGLGLTRLAMMKYHIPQIRLFNSGDLDFCSQFPAHV
jgi:phenylalanyl-tRNA synthetase alpha chain